jgi:hypothetical protein
MHSEWIRYCWESNELRALQAHRGAYKTTAVDIVGVVWWWLWFPDEAIAIIRKTFTDAAKVIAAVARIMDLPVIKALFSYAHGAIPKAITRRDGLLTYNFKKTITPEGSLTAHGLDGSLTGTHYGKIQCDDFATLKDRISKAERERTKEILREILTNVINPGKGVSLTGTPWAKGDAWDIIPCKILKFPVSKCNILSKKDIEHKKKTTTPFLYAANYDLELKSDENALFTEPAFQDFWQTNEFPVKAHLDAAFDGDHTCALTIMSKLNSKQLQGVGYVYTGNVKNWTPSIVKLCKQHRVSVLYNETNPDKGYTANKLSSEGLHCVSPYWESQNKHIKISTYLFEAWHSIIWCKETDDEYINQITDYREGQEPDDAPDSASSLVREGFPILNSSDSALWEF